MKKKITERKSCLDKVIFIFPLVFYLFTEIFRTIDEESYLDFRDEDGIVEYLTVVFYLIASYLSFLIAKFYSGKYRGRKLFYLMISALCFFIAMEEISWGQRIIGFKSPHFFAEYNNQSEFDIHNFEFVDFDLSSLFDFIFLLICLYGISSRFILKRKLGENISVYCPDKTLIFYFILSFLGVFWQFKSIAGYIDLSIMEYGMEGFNIVLFLFYDPEMAELLLSMAFLAFVYRNKKIINNSNN